jgi:hypothetical protein
MTDRDPFDQWIDEEYPLMTITTEDRADLTTAWLTILRDMRGEEDADLPAAAAMLRAVLDRHPDPREEIEGIERRKEDPQDPPDRS